MSSKSKDVKIEQLRILEKKLDLRLQQLAQKGTDKQTQRDPLVKNLKAKIRETNIRIKAIDKFQKLNEGLAQAKAQKLIDRAKKKEAPEPGATMDQAAAEPQKKKKSAAAEKEAKPKKKADGAADPESKKQPRKKKEE